jgi:hypothetical protein
MLPTRTLSGTRSTCAYLVLLRVEIARFTRTQSARLCCSNPHLGALRPFGGEVLPPTLSCAVRTFLQCGLSAHCLSNGFAACTSDGLAGFTPTLSTEDCKCFTVRAIMLVSA